MYNLYKKELEKFHWGHDGMYVIEDLFERVPNAVKANLSYDYIQLIKFLSGKINLEELDIHFDDNGETQINLEVDNDRIK